MITMKIYKYIALGALAMGIAACSQDDDFAPQQEDVVKIASSDIATEMQSRVNTLDDGTRWENGVQILLVNRSRETKNSGSYTATVGGETTTWAIVAGNVVLYAPSGTNDFTAYYPAVAEADYTLPTDQSTADGIKSADRMVATTTGVAKGAAVALSFVRRNAMVTIAPSFNTEFDADAVVSSMQIAGITPYHPENSVEYKAIIAPSADGFMVTLTVDGQSLTATSSTKIEAGRHYYFNLNVGKDAVAIQSVSVKQWDSGGSIDDNGIANEDIY